MSVVTGAVRQEQVFFCKTANRYSQAFVWTTLPFPLSSIVSKQSGTPCRDYVLCILACTLFLQLVLAFRSNVPHSMCASCTETFLEDNICVDCDLRKSGGMECWESEIYHFPTPLASVSLCLCDNCSHGNQ